MKDTEIHKGLPNSEIRDMLSKIISESMYNPAIEYPTDKKGFDARIEWAKRQIKHFEKEISNAENMKAVEIIAKTYNWKEYDVSDYVVGTDRLYRNFFGTEKEYENLCEKLDIEL
jgi:hypothetical protein